MNNINYIKDYNKNKILLYFSDIPSYSIRNTLKKNRWRYSPEGLFWYHYISVENEQLARSLGASDVTPKDSNPILKAEGMNLEKIRKSATLMFKKNIFDNSSLKGINLWLDLVQAPEPDVCDFVQDDYYGKDLGIILIDCRGYKHNLVFTDRKSHVNNINIFSIDEPFFSRILMKIIDGRYYILYKDEVHRISQIVYSHYYKSIVYHSRLLKSDYSRATIWIYNLKMPCYEHKKSIATVTAYVPVRDKHIVKPITVYYCPVCKKYYINSEQYQSFAKRYGLPFIRLALKRSEGNRRDYNEWNDESVLHSMGYNVSEKDGLNSAERQDVLKHAIDTGSMTKAEVLSFIESLIYNNENNYRFENACSKWREDLKAIREYNNNTQRTVDAAFNTNGWR